MLPIRSFFVEHAAGLFRNGLAAAFYELPLCLFTKIESIHYSISTLR